MCGKWIAKTNIPKGMADYGLFTELVLENNRKVHHLMTQPHPPRSASTPPFSRAQEQRWFESYQTLYQSCLNETQLVRLGYQPILKLKELIRSPLTGNRVNRIQLTDILADLHHQSYFASLMSIWVAEENTNTTYPRVEVAQLLWTLLSKKNYQDPKLLALYKGTIQQALELLHGKTPLSFVEWFKPRWTSNHAHPAAYPSWAQLAHDIVDLEVTLVKFSVDSETVRDPTLSDHPLSTRELDQRYPFLNWTYFFKFLKAKFGLKQPIRRINLRTPSYFEKLNRLIPTLSSDLMNYYLWWHLVRLHVPYLDNDSRAAMQGYYTGLDGLDARLSPPRETICTQKIHGDLMARWFVTQYFPTSALQHVEAMTQSILHEAQKKVNQSTWFDRASQAEANLKLSRMLLQLGYPKDQVELASFQHDIGQLQFNASGYLQNQIAIKQKNLHKTWSYLNPSPTKKIESPWLVSSLEVNAYYNSMNNEIVRIYIFDFVCFLESSKPSCLFPSIVD
jgi:predicted metalloendopeptidase